MNKLLNILLFLLFAVNTIAQSDTISIFRLFNDISSGKGEIVINQDPLIRLLVDRDIAINGNSKGISDGYRIQIFSSFGNDSRDRSRDARVDFLTLFPEFDPLRVYSTYEPPFIKVRIGDYRNKSEALVHYKKIVKKFPDCYMVKSKINYPSLK